MTQGLTSTGRFTDDLRRLRARSYDQCQSCGTRIQKDVPAYAGYAADGSPLYVGPCCAGRLHELASYVYWWWEADKRCDPGTGLWRYMDFAKFVALLESRTLYFARADLLGDPFEGASGIADRMPEWNAFYMDYFRNAVRTTPGRTAPVADTYVEQEAQRLFRDFSQTADLDRRRTFVSCWHANSGESEALWRLYCPPPVAGVAIRTTAYLLNQALGDNPNISIGRVQYVDFRVAFANLHDRIFWKRKSLSHEAEVRAVIKNAHPMEDGGIPVPVDLDKLLVEVVPSPFAARWFSPLVESTIRRYGVQTAVSKSELLAQPFY